MMPPPPPKKKKKKKRKEKKERSGRNNTEIHGWKQRPRVHFQEKQSSGNNGAEEIN